VEDLSSFKILIVDDEPDIRDYIRMVLEDNGATVIEACDGDEALDVARSEKPDLITLDIQMPNKNGSQAYEEMRKDPELLHIPVCIITGHPELRRLIYQRVVPPPDGYMDKPVDDQRLVMNLKKLLALSSRKNK